ncbi:MAG TPA: hypothetical protein VGK74_09420 [Symbiobacteriaceae bacterium]|jgi:hypothetical protein
MSYRGTALTGPAVARLAQLEGHLLRRNASAPALAPFYLEIGARLGVRGDLAYAQALLETNYFRYGGRTAPWQHNYGGLPAAGPGSDPCSFATPEDGVRAHLQQLHALCCSDPLPGEMPVRAPAYDRIPQGCAACVGDLTRHWPGATLAAYGETVDRILAELLLEPSGPDPYRIEPDLLDEGSPNRPGACAGRTCWTGVEGIVVARTASPVMDAHSVRRFMNAPPAGFQTAGHFVLDDQAILQLLPIGEITHHTTGKDATHLAIFVCEHNWGTAAWDETYRKLVWLTARLARAFCLDPSRVSGRFWWDLSSPYDPTHLGWSPDLGRATGLFDWNRFIADVAAGVATDVTAALPPDAVRAAPESEALAPEPPPEPGAASGPVRRGAVPGGVRGGPLLWHRLTHAQYVAAVRGPKR